MCPIDDSDLPENVKRPSPAPFTSKDGSLLGNDILTCLCKHEGEHPLLRQAAIEIRELRERLFFATIPPASPEQIEEARRQGKLPAETEWPHSIYTAALREAREHILDNGNERTMAPVIEHIDNALNLLRFNRPAVKSEGEPK